MHELEMLDYRAEDDRSYQTRFYFYHSNKIVSSETQ